MTTDSTSETDPHAATLAALARSLGEGVFTMSRFRDNLRLFVPASRLASLLGVLKRDCGCDLLADLGAADYLGYPDRTRGSRFTTSCATSTPPS